MKALARVWLIVILGLIAAPAVAQRIHGTATYRERMALPAGAVFEATIEDVSRADAPAAVIATTRMQPPGNPPIPFILAYDQARIVPNGRYVVRARILVDGNLLFTSDAATPVITGGSPTNVSITLRRVGTEPAAPAAPGPTTPSTPGASRLEATYWRAIAQKPDREAHLVFREGGRLSGSDGCNRFSGSYELEGEGITLGQMLRTQMACVDTPDIEREFQAALQSASRWRIVGDRLELLDANGARLAAFQARPQAP
jgi:putative lipoprotein